jgi:hypothetical protein
VALTLSWKLLVCSIAKVLFKYPVLTGTNVFAVAKIFWATFIIPAATASGYRSQRHSKHLLSTSKFDRLTEN